MGKFVPLLFANLGRHRLRTLLTTLSIVIALILLNTVDALRRE